MCGQGQVCRRVGSREGLARAKATVEASYPVVGVTEELGAPPHPHPFFIQTSTGHCCTHIEESSKKLFLF